ncbi:MAG TPA: TRAP transporter substrate-binding protein DctP [Burkholderiales bacterium]|nr:TRAP transporter substrate-binding protein DctP [Burkholderiales bacterium]
MTKTFRIAALVALAAAGVATPALAQDRLTAVHAFPANWVYSKSFLQFVKKANDAGKGVFAIQVRGGPEAIGMFEQPNAARDGVVDMVYTPCAFYAGSVPECDAVSASTIDGPIARRNGAYDALKEAHIRRMGVYYLGWFDSGIRFNLWSTKEPRFDAQGNLDIRGVKIRGNPIYNAFFTNVLGASVLNMPSTDVYTALERGTIDMTGWTQIGIMDANWDKFLKYRLEPPFFSTDLGIIINVRKWNALSDKTKEILNRVAIEHEVSSVKELQALRTKEFAELGKRGLKAVSMKPDAGKRFAEGAREASYQRMKERMEKAGGRQEAERFIKLFGPGS